jgi:hypothetical protein
MAKTLRFVMVLLIGAALATTAHAQTPRAVLPGTEWATTTPIGAGWSADGLAQAHAYLA